MKIKKGDKVKIIYGKDKGREGKVEKIFTKQEKVLIPEVNLYKKHIKKNEKMPQGGVVEIPRPLPASKVMVICPNCQKPTRIKIETIKGKKTRICKKCQNKI